MNCLLDTLDTAHPERADEPSRFMPCEFRIKWAATDWEREQALSLRRAVFCVEQGIFVGDDRDAIDDHAQLLVALSCVGGAPDAVVGTVRIHEESPGHWWGSRLAVYGGEQRARARLPGVPRACAEPERGDVRAPVLALAAARNAAWPAA